MAPAMATYEHQTLHWSKEVFGYMYLLVFIAMASLVAYIDCWLQVFVAATSQWADTVTVEVSALHYIHSSL